MTEAPRRRRGRRGEHAQSLVEFALILPIFLLIVFAIVDFGMGFRAWISITNAAREGARVGAIRGDCESIIDQVKATSGGLVTSDDQVTITPEDCDGAAGSDVIVTVTYDYGLVSPIGGFMSMVGGGIPSSFTITSSSNMRVE